MDKQRAYCPPEVLDSEDPLFMLYTSGSTGKPKGLVSIFFFLKNINPKNQKKKGSYTSWLFIIHIFDTQICV